MRHTARIGRTSFWAEAVGCAMGRRDSVLRRGEGRAGARERVLPGRKREPGRGLGRAPRVGGGRARDGGKGVVPGRGARSQPESERASERERGTGEGAAGRGAARLMEQERGGERSGTSVRHRQTRN